MAKWTSFHDMHSGGGQKLDWARIFIEAPEDEAVRIFYSRFGRNPHRVTCTCCGEDYSVYEEATLERATAFPRNCEWRGENYVEEQKQQTMDIRARCGTPDSDPWGLYQTVEEYEAHEDVLVIRAKEITDKERSGPEPPEEGYVWAEDDG